MSKHQNGAPAILQVFLHITDIPEGNNMYKVKGPRVVMQGHRSHCTVVSVTVNNQSLTVALGISLIKDTVHLFSTRMHFRGSLEKPKGEEHTAVLPLQKTQEIL